MQRVWLFYESYDHKEGGCDPIRIFFNKGDAALFLKRFPIQHAPVPVAPNKEGRTHAVSQHEPSRNVHYVAYDVHSDGSLRDCTDDDIDGELTNAITIFKAMRKLVQPS
jgi:hypothetical protein